MFLDRTQVSWGRKFPKLTSKEQKHCFYNSWPSQETSSTRIIKISFISSNTQTHTQTHTGPYKLCHHQFPSFSNHFHLQSCGSRTMSQYPKGPSLSVLSISVSHHKWYVVLPPFRTVSSTVWKTVPVGPIKKPPGSSCALHFSWGVAEPHVHLQKQPVHPHP